VSHTAKRKQLIWLLAAVLLVLLAGIAYELYLTKSNTPASRRAEDISTITIQRANAKTIVLQQIDDNWRVTEPVEMAANRQRIVPLLTVYTNPDPGYAISDVDLIETGLNVPEVTLLFNDYAVEIGKLAIEGDRRHARHGERISFVPDWVLPLATGGISAFADLTVWGETLSEIMFTDNSTLAESSLAAARTLTAQQFVLWPRDDAPATLAVHRVEVTTADGSKNWTITITERYSALQAEDSAYAYIVSSNDITWLPQP